MATSYKTSDSSGEFFYELTYSQAGPGFTMHSLSIEHNGKKVFNKQDMESAYASEALLLAQGVNMCETVANHLRTP